MGHDGAAGLMEIRRAGGNTIGQDAQSSRVYGMPRVAAERGAVQHQVPLSDIAAKIRDLTAATLQGERVKA
jgi:two-component system chemotaxis response regulator CheB